MGILDALELAARAMLQELPEATDDDLVTFAIESCWLQEEDKKALRYYAEEVVSEIT